MANHAKFSLGAIILVVIAGYLGFNNSQTGDANPSTSNFTPASSGSNQPHVNTREAADDLDKISTAFQQQRGNVQVQSKGQVITLLRDDNEGSRHQKFLLQLANGQTVLVAHNIDLAPRIANLQKGDVVEFYGEYEYSNKGGVIHWTHHDPQNQHVGGWLKHRGQMYQ